MKIIVLSGQNDDDNARHARTLGAVEFVGKPCDPGHLLRTASTGAAILTAGNNRPEQAAA
jgi:CheY-like chemotaxis protein